MDIIISKTLHFNVLSAILLCCLIGGHSYDLPCAARYMQANRSVVCVCNSTYCDTITREEPALGTYVAYTSSNAGLRLYKTYGKFINACQPRDSKLYVLSPLRLYQTIIGFGGAVTDSAAFNWRSLSLGAQYNLISTYFSENGSEYSIIRTPIGGSDFSMRVYAYNEYPVNDTYLTNFTLTWEDLDLKIPMIKSSMNMATGPVMIFGSTWSPPPWMKSSNAFTGESRLLLQYYQTYADYHCRFAQEYYKYGIKLWGFTTTNEPLDGVLGLVNFQTLGFNFSGMGTYIEKNLGPTLKRCPVENLGIMANDDQRISLTLYFNAVLETNPRAIDYIDGIAFHWYSDKYSPPEIISDIIRDYEDKFVLMTEACAGAFPSDMPKVDLGSWERANDYITNILQNLSNAVGGWVDWNLCLDMEGGPNWVSNFVDSAIIVNAKKDEFYKQPTFYALAHVSKFVPPGSRRIKVIETAMAIAANEFYYYDSQDVRPEDNYAAFLTPRNSIVFIIQNIGDYKTISIRLGEEQMEITLEAESITTIEFPYDASSLCQNPKGAHPIKNRGYECRV